MYGDGPSFKQKRRATLAAVRTPSDFSKMQRVLDETLMADKEKNQKKELETIQNKYSASSYDVNIVPVNHI